MTIRDSERANVTVSIGRPSHRTLPEQIVGLGIYLTIGLGFAIATGLITQSFATLYALCISFGMWALWRRFSLRVLKLELSVFLAQFLFQMLWSVSNFVLEQSLLVLVASLLLSCNTLLAMLLFWKKERPAALLYALPLLWTFYLAMTNMISCITNP